MSLYSDIFDTISQHPDWDGARPDNAALLAWGSDPDGVTRDRLTVTADELYGGIDPSKFTDAASVQWWAEHINTTGGLTVTELNDLSARVPTAIRVAFDAALKQANKAEFAALIPETLSRFQDKGIFIDLEEADIAEARRRFET